VASITGAVFIRPVSDWLVILFLIVLTRGLHQDGLADTVDGWLGGQTVEERLRIMRDGSIGALGATALFLALALRYAGLSAWPSADRVSDLICMPVVGRWAMLIGGFRMPYARSAGLAQSFLDGLSTRTLVIASVTALVIVAWRLGAVRAVVLLVVSGLVARTISMMARRRIGGTTGDVLGATNEAAEIAFVLTVPFAGR
jgi:adenosylcobinamide-GDP ribazoletransferase